MLLEDPARCVLVSRQNNTQVVALLSEPGRRLGQRQRFVHSRSLKEGDAHPVGLVLSTQAVKQRWP